MATVISSTVKTFEDINGNRETRATVLIEFRDAAYFTGAGENLALANLMDRIEFIQAQPVSGALQFTPEPNMGDLPANAGSARMHLFYVGSQAITVSGTIPAATRLIEVVSGTAVSGARALLHIVGN